MAKQKTLTTKGRDPNPRVGCKGGDYMMPVSFESATFTTALLRQIQRHYRTGYFTQRELAEHFNVSYGLAAKACRIAKENGGEEIG